MESRCSEPAMFDGSGNCLAWNMAGELPATSDLHWKLESPRLFCAFMRSRFAFCFMTNKLLFGANARVHIPFGGLGTWKYRPNWKLKVTAVTYIYRLTIRSLIWDDVLPRADWSVARRFAAPLNFDLQGQERRSRLQFGSRSAFGSNLHVRWTSRLSSLCYSIT
jgi:hypothetical protein